MSFWCCNRYGVLSFDSCITDSTQYTYSVFECRSDQGERIFECSADEISPESNESNVNVRASSQSRHSHCSKCNSATTLQIHVNICISEEEKFAPDLVCCLTNTVEV